jgi:outer membrane protein
MITVKKVKMHFCNVMLKKISVVIVGLIASMQASGQVTFNSLEEVWHYADAHSIAILTGKYELRKTGYATKQSYSSILPQVNATGSYTDNIMRQTTLIPGEIGGGPSGSFIPLQFGTQFVYVGGIQAQMSAFNLQNWYATRIAEYTETLYKDSVRSLRRTVYQQVATQYYSYLLMQEAARLADITVSVADSVLEAVSNKYVEGVVDEGNLDVAKLNSERSKQNAINSYYQMLIAKNNLKGFLGMTVADSLVIRDKLDSSKLANLYIQFEEDPSIRVAEDRAKMSLSQLKQANAAFAPSFNIVYNVVSQRYDSRFRPFSDATGTAAWFPAQYWALQANLPIFSSGYRWFQSKKMKLNYRENQVLFENTVRQSAINDQNILLNYQRSVEVLKKTRNVMNLGMDNYRHMTYRYDAGLESLENRLRSFRDFIDYQNQYLVSLSDLLVQLYQVKIRQQTF